MEIEKKLGSFLRFYQITCCIKIIDNPFGHGCLIDCGSIHKKNLIARALKLITLLRLDS